MTARTATNAETIGAGWNANAVSVSGWLMSGTIGSVGSVRTITEAETAIRDSAGSKKLKKRERLEARMRADASGLLSCFLLPCSRAVGAGISESVSERTRFRYGCRFKKTNRDRF